MTNPTSAPSRLQTLPGWLALILACTSLQRTCHTQQYLESERVTVVAATYSANYPVNLQVPWQPAIQAIWSCVLSNNGQQRLSISSFKVLEDFGDHLSGYPGLTDALLDDKLSAISLPFSLDAGEARRLQIRLAVVPSPRVKALLAKQFENTSTVSADEVRSFLLRYRIDIYDNHLSGTFVGVDGSTGWMYSESPRGQLFDLSFTTHRENTFRCKAHFSL